MSHNSEKGPKPRLLKANEEIDSFSLVGFSIEDDGGPWHGVEAPLLGLSLSPSEENSSRSETSNALPE